ncbi:MAG: hypothetical protein HW409_1535 [candidate division NC10 bacterium]|nr:hypothetical protein [candidate division NC10 bacterium]
MALIEILAELRYGLIKHGGTDGDGGHRLEFVLQPFGQLTRLTRETGGILLPRVCDFLEQAGEPGTAPAIVRRKIRAGKERLLIRRQEDRHRPSTLTMIEGHRGLHIDLVEIWALFPIDFDTDKMPVHE